MYAVTFYSYKGGVGRSLLVANCAHYLAQLGLRVVALDLDLEAPGLHYKFADLLPPGFVPRRGVVDLISDYATRDQLYESLADVVFEVPLGDSMPEPGDRPQGKLLVIPAGASPSLEYWKQVASIDWKRFLYDEGATGLEFFVDLRDRISAELEPDLLLIDSRTGITEIGNVATSVLADAVVCIVAGTAENLEGSRAVLRGLQRHRRLSDGAHLDFRIAVSRPHPSIPLAARLEEIRAFLEDPAEMLDATLSVGTPYPLTYSPEMEQRERLVVGADFEQTSQLSLDYMAIAEEILPEPLQSKISSWSPTLNSPYPYSVWSYSRLVLENPNVPIEGLYRLGRRCIIVIPGFNPDMRAADGRPLPEWFTAENAAGVSMNLVDRVSEGAVLVPEPCLADLVELRDLPRSARDIDTELALRLPRTFPRFTTRRSDAGGTLLLDVERALRADEHMALRRALAPLNYSPTLRPSVRVTPAVASDEPRFQRGPQGDIDLVPSRRLPFRFSKEVRDLVARDEDLWMSSRLAIHRGEINDPAAILPAWRRTKGSRFLAGSQAFSVPEVHRLLPYCEQLIVTLPLRKRCDENLTSMGLPREELLALAGEGRVIVLIPQSTDRYDPALLNDLAQRAPDSLIWSRTLCAATMIELRRRLYPWFFPGFDLQERRERLHRASAREPWSQSSTSFLQPAEFSRFLADVWSREELLSHTMGAAGASFLGGGFGTLLSRHVEHLLKREFILEAHEAGASVAVAAALGAAMVPMQRLEYSLLPFTWLGARLMTWLSDAYHQNVTSIVLDLPDRKMSAMELSRLHGRELENVRELVCATAQGAGTSALDTAHAQEVCRRMLVSAGVLTESNESLTFGAHPRGIASADLPKAEPVSMSVLRDSLAGGSAAGQVVDVAAEQSRFPPIIVGEFS